MSLSAMPSMSSSSSSSAIEGKAEQGAGSENSNLHFEHLHASALSSARSSPYAELLVPLLSLPTEDVRIEYIDRPMRTLGSAVPEEAEDEGQLPHVKDCIKIFTKRFVRVHYSFRHLGGQCTIENYIPDKKDLIMKIQTQIYDSDLESQNAPSRLSSNSSSNLIQSGNSLRADLLRPLTTEDITDSIQKRSQSRFSLFFLVPSFRIPQPTDFRVIPDLPLLDPKESTNVFLEVKELTFDKLGSKAEPYFLTFAMYDTKEKRQMTETFSVALNTQDLPWPEKHELSLHADRLYTQGNAAIFPITNPTEDCMIVVRVEKILMGSQESATALYFKSKIKDKRLSEHSLLVKDSIQRLGFYTQPLAIGVIPVFRKGGLPINMKPTPITLDRLMRPNGADSSDASLWSSLKYLISEKNSAKVKFFTASLSLVLGFVESKDIGLMKCVSPSNVPLRSSAQSSPVSSPASSSDGASITCPLANGVNSIKLAPETCVRQLQEFKTYNQPGDQQKKLANFYPHYEWSHLLYVYPLNCNFEKWSTRRGDARNLAVRVEIRSSDAENPASAVLPDSLPLKRVFGSSKMPDYVQQQRTSVLHHDIKPQWHKEVKINLPAKITPSHHILFTVDHIVCQNVSKKSSSSSKKSGSSSSSSSSLAVQPNTLAFGVLPLLNNRSEFILDSDHGISLAYGLPQNYLASSASMSTSYIDRGRKPNFTVSTKLVSTIQTQDWILNNFFSVYDKLEDYQDLLAYITNLRNLSAQTCIQWFPVITTCLCNLMAQLNISISLASFQTLLYVVDMTTQIELGASVAPGIRSHLIESFVCFILEDMNGGASHLFHETLVFCWTRTIEQADQQMRLLLARYSWFFLEVMSKTMAVAWIKQQQQERQNGSKKCAFAHNFYQNLTTLFVMLADEIQQLPLDIATELNRNIAFFIADLLGVMDPGACIELIVFYVRRIAPVSTDIHKLKFRFLQIISNYEHFIALNIPNPFAVKDAVELEDLKNNRHFLMRLLIIETCDTLKAKNASLSHTAIDLLYYLLLKQEIDPRNRENTLARPALANCFFSFIIQLIDLYDADELIFLKSPFEVQTKALLILLYIVQNLPANTLEIWWKSDTQRRVINFFILLSKAVSYVEYGNHQLQQAINASSSSGTPSSSLPSIAFGSSTANVNEDQFFRRRVDSVIITDNYDPMRPMRRDVMNVEALNRFAGQDNLRGERGSSNTHKSIQESGMASLVIEGNLARESAMIVLDVLMRFVHSHIESLQQPGDTMLSKVVMGLLNVLLQTQQCEDFMKHLFDVVKQIVYHFQRAIFVETTGYCADLVYGVLRHCNSVNPITNNAASSLFYLLLKTNFQVTRNISRMKLQATIAVSKLAGEGVVYAPERFQNALKAVSHYVRFSDLEFSQFTEGHNIDLFRSSVAELSERLLSVLQNSARISDFSYDPEMTADLYYEISKGYIASPDLRAAWLLSLASFHKLQHNYEEASQCKIHVAALILVYMNKLKPSEKINVNQKQFDRASPNCLLEMQVPPEAFEEDGICQSSTFTRSGFFTQLVEAVSYLKKDLLYESCIAVERLMLTIHRENRNFEEMAKLFSELQSMCEKIIDFTNYENQRFLLSSSSSANISLTSSSSSSSSSSSDVSGSGGVDLNSLRKYSNFFHVTLVELGSPEEEFIYKERGKVTMSKLQERLRKQYEGKYGQGSVIVLSQTASIPKGEVGGAKFFIRVIPVEVYLDQQEISSPSRTSAFLKQFNIKRFVHRLESTTTGKAFSKNIAELITKSTIYSTEFSFPFVIKRQRVISKVDSVLSPIQTAKTYIDERCDVMKQHLHCDEANAGLVKQALASCVSNQTPLSPQNVCEVFLKNSQVRASYPQADVEALMESLRRYISQCGRMVMLHSSLIEVDQLPAHEKLEREFLKLLEIVSPFVQLSSS